MTYNGAATVARALTTLLAQTYRDYELIISDDHSTDETLAICQRLAAGHEQVRFIRPERNLGSEHNMKFALTHAGGKYFVWASQDDYWEPEFLARLVGTLEQSPGAVCAQGAVRWTLEDGSTTHELRLKGRDIPERQSRLALATSIFTGRSREYEAGGAAKVFKNNIFMHGVWDRAAFAAALDAHGKPFIGERQILYQLALAGRFRYVDELLFSKTYYDVDLDERYPMTDATVIARKDKRRWLELRDTLAAIARSPIIDPQLKIIAMPVLSCAFFLYRFKATTRFVKKLRKAVTVFSGQ